MDERNASRELIDFIGRSPTPYHAAAAIAERLRVAGFIERSPEDAWTVEPGKGYFTVRHDTLVLAFRMGTGDPVDTGFRLVGTHTDSPGFRIKPAPAMKSEGSYLRLNTEVYGGPIHSTWMDRPLSVAGRLLVAADRPLHPGKHLIDFRRPLLVIPNLAIHMNREMNRGVELNPQVDLLPLAGMLTEGGNAEARFRAALAAEAGLQPGEIVDFDLCVYDPSPGCLLGLDEELLSAPRLDNLEAVHAGLTALLNAEAGEATQVLVCFDHEEVGSATRQGADSPILAESLRRIAAAAGGRGVGDDSFSRVTARSFLFSVDAAHAVHPNRSEKHDPTNRPVLNGGPVLKRSARQSYITDGESAAVFRSLCDIAGVPFQQFLNRSDERGGSTIGALSSTQLPVRGADIGIPLLAMHSVRETCGMRDHASMIRLLEAFYRT